MGRTGTLENASYRLRKGIYYDGEAEREEVTLPYRLLHSTRYYSRSYAFDLWNSSDQTSRFTNSEGIVPSRRYVRLYSKSSSRPLCLFSIGDEEEIVESKFGGWESGIDWC